jgi:hypothetical protein
MTHHDALSRSSLRAVLRGLLGSASWCVMVRAASNHWRKRAGPFRPAPGCGAHGPKLSPLSQESRFKTEALSLRRSWGN